MRKTLILLLPLLSLWFAAHADIATPGEVQRQFEIVNLDEFSDYSFWVMKQTYYYEYGYQEGDLVKVDVVDAGSYFAGNRGSSSLLYAKNEAGEEFQSEIFLGGSDIIAERYRGVVDQYKIKKIADGKIELKPVGEVYIDRDGKRKEKSGVFGGGIDSRGKPWYYFVIPVLCVIMLGVFFMLKRKKSATAA